MSWQDKISNTTTDMRALPRDKYDDLLQAIDTCILHAPAQRIAEQLKEFRAFLNGRATQSPRGYVVATVSFVSGYCGIVDDMLNYSYAATQIKELMIYWLVEAQDYQIINMPIDKCVAGRGKYHKKYGSRWDAGV